MAGNPAHADHDLWQGFLSGNRHALSAVYQAHYKAMFRYGLKLTADEALVEDCIQDLFVDLWRRRHKLGATSSIRFYLIKAMRHKLLRRLADRSKATAMYPDGGEPSFLVEYSIEDSLVEEAGAAERREKLARALERLTPRQKEAVYLRYFNDLSYEEIGTVMGIGLQSIRTLIYQALHFLRDHMVYALLLFPFLG